MSAVPLGWTEASLKELMNGSLFTDGDWIESKDQDPSGGIRLIQLADVGEGTFRDRSSRFVNAGTVERLRCTVLRGGDVLVARMPDPLGRACLVPTMAMEVITAVDVCVLRPDPSSVHAPWLMWAMNTPQVRRQVLALQTGTTRKRISRKNLSTVLLAVPPLAEQKRIVAAIEEQFSRLDTATVSLMTAAQRLRRFQPVLLASAVNGALIGEDASRWPVRTVADLASEVRYGTSVRTDGDASGIPVLRMGNVVNGDLLTTRLRYLPPNHHEFPTLLLDPGDILFNRTNSPELVGKAAVYRGDPPLCSFASYLIRVRLKSGCLPEILAYFLNSPFGRDWARTVVSQQVGQANINGTKLKALAIRVPPEQEQVRLVDEVESQLSRVKSLQQALVAAQRRADGLRRVILREAFAGRLVAHAPEDSAYEKVQA